ncbi:CRISPR-associated helicase Cas3' [Vulcanisaeta distributa]|uniref:Helicase domain protein n=1 Tax=Vulcanisaeta distributa (strain DSM 14429 / JCM 11212 / NBRC 100878 / IC-017) TaxID=572478 RepID=E1QU70_VULDI|nr:CRISPR-associated helicase Cas3' [Vulcanisaeta distributa]ADN51064.1 helicase domain protein [Vulcanisaeta distributa DSM 14429]
MRELVNEAINGLVNEYPHISTVIVEAPTGYGKTFNSHIPFLKFKDMGLARGFIYVAPTRALVRQQARDFLIKLQGQGFSITYQSMDVNLKVEVPNIRSVSLTKNPLLSSDVNVTTIDSFMFNLMRMPVESLNKPVKWRYATYRSYIFTSYVFLDEIHLMVEGSGLQLSSILLGIHELTASFTPSIIASATLGSGRIKCIATGKCGDTSLETYREVANRVRVYRLGKENSKDGVFVTIRDKDWEDKTCEQNFNFKELNNIDEIIKIIKEQYSRVLILTNTVKKAVDIYNLVSGIFGSNNVVLLHGKLDEYDRDINARNIDNARIIVGTDAIGVGINPPNVNVLITDIPSSIDTFIQRIGRICRNVEQDRDCHVYLLREGEEEEIPKYYTEVRDKLHEFNWRLPYDCVKKRGYDSLINSYVEFQSPDISSYQDLYAKLSFIVIDQEDLKRSYRRYCNLIRDSVLIRGITNVDEPLTYSMALSMRDAEVLAKEYGKDIDIVAYALHEDGNLQKISINNDVKESVLKELADERKNECNRYFEINNEINKLGSSYKALIIWGIDVSRIYRRGLGLVI